MKFGLLDFNLTVESYWNHSWNHKALLNIGDAAEYLVVEQLYHSLGIDEKQIRRLAIPELTTYCGESLIVALNIALDSYVGYNDLLDHLSPNIIPVFLGMSFTSPDFNLHQIDCLKQYAPIGCRDERSYFCMKKLGIPCYLNGCTASILEIDEEPIPQLRDKVVFIDVPHEVLEFVPQEMKNDIVLLNQELYCKKSELPSCFLPSDWAKKILSCYNSGPRMIVTSRFHGAVLALANDIPVIVALEKYTFRFSWIQNYCPIYTEKSFCEIDWNPKLPDYRVTRNLILEISQKRIKETIDRYRCLLQLTDLQRITEDIGERECSNQVLYYRKTWEQIKKTWNPQKEYLYGFWGVNDNTEALYSLISQTYPKARLVNIYDMFKSISFAGLDSQRPHTLSEYVAQENYYVIVTAYLASRVAPDICGECGFPQNRTFLCMRDFILAEDIDPKYRILDFIE